VDQSNARQQRACEQHGRAFAHTAPVDADGGAMATASIEAVAAASAKFRYEIHVLRISHRKTKSRITHSASGDDQ